MHAVAISGSPRKEGNTFFLLQRCLDRFKEKGISGEYFSLAGKTVRTCIACGTCQRKLDKTCSNKADDFHPIFEGMLRADILIVGSPVYFGSAAPELMSLLDRAGYVSRANGHLFSRKIGGPIAVARRAGHNFTYAQLAFWFTINDMMLAGSTYWNVGLAREPKQIAEDAEALATIDRFVDNLAWMGERLQGPS